MELREALVTVCGDLGLSLSPVQLTQITIYAELLTKWGARLSLTTVTDADELARFHFAEAFWACETFLAGSERIADIGSGAGFPGLAMKIFRPEATVTLLERNLKKVVFLQTVRSSLQMDLRIVQTSAEAWNHWDEVDLAVMRAVKPDQRLLKPLVDLEIPLLYFQGKESNALPAPWNLAQKKPYPLSNQRFMGVWEIKVSRETHP